MKTASLYIRIFAAWLIAMQPLIAAYSAAQAATATPGAELCRGAAVPAGMPFQEREHTECCLGACAAFAASAPDRIAAAAPLAVHTAGTLPTPRTVLLPRAGLGPQSARAPPL